MTARLPSFYTAQLGALKLLILASSFAEALAAAKAHLAASLDRLGAELPSSTPSDWVLEPIGATTPPGRYAGHVMINAAAQGAIAAAQARDVWGAWMEQTESFMAISEYRGPEALAGLLYVLGAVLHGDKYDADPALHGGEIAPALLALADMELPADVRRIINGVLVNGVI